MRLHIDHQITVKIDSNDQSEILKLLKDIKNQNKELMARTQEQWESILTRIDAATTNIAQQLRDLKDQIANQGLPADVEEAIFTRLDTAATQLEQVGASPENPVPPVEPTPEA